MISRLRKNCMGTVSFDGMFPGQRKAQDFVVYPIHGGNRTDRIMVQSDKRIGYIYLESGGICMTPSIPGGAYGKDLARAFTIGVLPADELLLLKANVFATASGQAGKRENGFIQTDNSGAIEVMGML